ncbi:MAG: DivIVA protein [Actinomycetota bacterium]|jgi:DivIVA domain-containing protein|nr:DivIVA protein [Actinomycetota bacterium]
MPIIPEEIATATFSRTRQGYHPGEVQAFLSEVAADYSAALEKMFLASSEPAELDVGREVNAILQTARESASALMQRSQEDSEAILKAATEKAQGIETQASEARVRAFEEANKAAQDVKTQADQYAFELRNRTEHEISQMVERAEARARQLYAYNQQLSEHLVEIESLVGVLRTEIDTPRNAWPNETTEEKPVRIDKAADDSLDDEQPIHLDEADDRENLIVADMHEDLQKEGV